MQARKFFVLLAFALTAGGAASYLSVTHLRGMTVAAEVAPAPAPAVRYVVAARDLGPGTVLTEADLRLAEWGAAQLPASFSASAEELVGRTVTQTIAVAEPVTRLVVASGEAGPGVSGLIPAGMRAVSIPVDKVVGVSGFVLPGTRVDVIATIEQDGGSAVTRLVLQDVEALAAGHALQPDREGTPQEVAVVTLLVTPAEAERLVLAMHRGRLQLALRNRLDQEQVATGRAAPVQSGGRAAPTPAAAPQPHRVEVYRAGSRSVVELTPRPVAGS